MSRKLLEIIEEVKNVIGRAEDKLKCDRFIVDEINNSGGWNQFKDRKASITGTTFGVIALSYKITNFYTFELAKKFIIQNQNSENGGWEKNDALGECLTRITALSVYAILKLGTQNCKECKAVKRGIKWILKTQNEDGGWGTKFGVTSDVTSSLWAVKALSLSINSTEVRNRLKLSRDYFLSYDFIRKKEIEWKYSSLDETTSNNLIWGFSFDALEALLIMGVPKNEICSNLTNTIIKLSNDNLLSEPFSYSLKVGENELTLHWTYMPNFKILKILLMLGVNPDSQVILRLVNQICFEENNGVWEISGVAAIWAIEEALSSLRLFMKRYESTKYQSQINLINKKLIVNWIIKVVNLVIIFPFKWIAKKWKMLLLILWAVIIVIGLLIGGIKMPITETIFIWIKNNSAFYYSIFGFSGAVWLFVITIILTKNKNK